jgi:hypothetical protein
VILDNNDNIDKVNIKNKAKGASSDVDSKHIKRDASLYNPFITLKLALAPIELIDISSLLYDAKEDRYIKELLDPGLGPYK